jgi:hypothetical protein
LRLAALSFNLFPVVNLFLERLDLFLFAASASFLLEALSVVLSLFTALRRTPGPAEPLFAHFPFSRFCHPVKVCL